MVDVSRVGAQRMHAHDDMCVHAGGDMCEHDVRERDIARCDVNRRHGECEAGTAVVVHKEWFGAQRCARSDSHEYGMVGAHCTGESTVRACMHFGRHTMWTYGVECVMSAHGWRVRHDNVVHLDVERPGGMWNAIVGAWHVDPRFMLKCGHVGGMRTVLVQMHAHGWHVTRLGAAMWTTEVAHLCAAGT